MARNDVFNSKIPYDTSYRLPIYKSQQEDNSEPQKRSISSRHPNNNHHSDHVAERCLRTKRAAVSA